MIPSSQVFDQSTLASLLEHDPLIADYRAFFALLDLSVVADWQAARSVRVRPAHPESAYLKAFLLRIREGLSYTSQLCRFLLHHPLARHRTRLSVGAGSLCCLRLRCRAHAPQ